MSTLVIQLGRLGDVIQTTPLLQQLAAQRSAAQPSASQKPDDRLDLLVVEPNQHPLSGLPGITAIHTVTEKLKPLDDQIATGFPQGEISPEAWSLLRDLNLPHYDRVINASHSALGCWLAGEVSCDSREGGVINREDECLYNGAPHTYRVALLAFREQNWFNLVDLLRCAGPSPGKPSPLPSLYVNTAPSLPFALPPGRKIALNVGANEQQRRWPAQHFAQLAESLLSHGLIPILVGAPSDRDACAEVEALSKTPLPNFAGKTSISEMARLLKECDLLISSDTGAVHIAAAVGTTVVGLYGATAYFAETAPWGQGHAILQTPLGTPLSELATESVLAVALNRLGLLQESALREELQRRNQAAWETRFLPPEADVLGGVYYRPLHQHSLQAADLFTRALRHSFAQLWCGRWQKAAFHTFLDYMEDKSEGAPSRELRQQTSAVVENARRMLQILDQMSAAALECESVAPQPGAADTSPESCSLINAIAPGLALTLQNLLKSVSCEDQTMLRPVAHYLDWRLRMMPALPPAETFRYHAQEYRAAASLLRQASSTLTSFVEGNTAKVVQRS